MGLGRYPITLGLVILERSYRGEDGKWKHWSR
jgi:hypothetical protein